jgi:hypothetical protein
LKTDRETEIACFSVTPTGVIYQLLAKPLQSGQIAATLARVLHRTV